MLGPDRTFTSAWKRAVHNWRLFRAAKAASKAGDILRKEGAHHLAYQAYQLTIKIAEED